MEIKLITVDYNHPQQGKDLVMLLNGYAIDPMGGGEPLSDFVQQNLVATLAKQSHVFTVLCYVDGEPAGIVNCVEGFSTFSCMPLVNIHDVGVLTKFRGLGLSAIMLNEVEKIAREKGCCKLTLEVLEGNTIAQKAYKKLGFAGYELNPEMGKAMFWQKKLS